MKKIIVLIAFSFFLVGCSKGKASFEDLKSLDSGLTTEKVVEYVGDPVEKTINKDEIMDWAPSDLSNYDKLEMYVYDMESDRKARLFFSDNKLVYKRPVGLNQ